MELYGRRVLVVGMEKSGRACVRFLVARGARVTATDLKPVEDLDEEEQVEFAMQTDELFARDFDLVVLSPGVPFDLPGVQGARKRGAKVIGEVELAAPYLQGKTIAITGSNGKTTTTALTGHILHHAGVAVQVGGNIGTQVIAMVETSRPEQWNVLELSSFQLETIETFRAHVGVCLNVTQNHLDRHHTFENYAAAKSTLFRAQGSGDFAVLNARDAVCRSFATLTRGQVIWFAEGDTNSPVMVHGEHLMPEGEIPIRGRHNAENVMAAATAATIAGVNLADAAQAVRTFTAVEHRLEFVRKVSGVDFYNDSKATSVDATLKALGAFPSGLWVILGGKDKGSDYRILREPLSARAKAALLIGAAAEKIAEHLSGAVPLIQSGTLENAVNVAYQEASGGDTVLLAPACSSFDQFRSYEHRGQVFKDLVAKLPEKGPGKIEKSVRET